MKSDRTTDLSLSRELTERQREQQWVEQQRALNLARTLPDNRSRVTLCWTPGGELSANYRPVARGQQAERDLRSLPC